MFASLFPSACYASTTVPIEPRGFHDVLTRVHDVLDTFTTPSSLSTSADSIQPLVIDQQTTASLILHLRRLGSIPRAADGPHASTRLVSTSSTSSTPSQTPHDRPTSRRRRCGCVGFDELLLHQLRLQKTSTGSRLPSTLSPRHPRVHHGLNTTTTSSSRRQASASSSAASTYSRQQDRENWDSASEFNFHSSSQYYNSFSPRSSTTSYSLKQQF